MARKRLTAKGVERLQTNRRQEDFWDELTPGLCIRVSGITGRKTWLVRYRANGKHRRHKLGEFPNMTLAEARDEARDALAKADAGGDPAQERAEKKKGAGTFGAMAREVLDAKAKRTRKNTIDLREGIFQKDLLPAWGNRPAGSITRREVIHLCEKIADRAPVQANRTLQLIRVLYNEAIQRGFPGVEHNPAHLVKPVTEEKGRDRYLSRDEIPVVWRAMEEELPLTRYAFQLALLTAQRIGSILAMQWDKIEENGSGALWTIPSERFKGKRTHLVPLSPEALEIVRALREIATDDEWVFPSQAGSKVPYRTNPAPALIRVRERTGLDHWVLHDFRTTFRTHATRSPEDGGLGVAGNVADLVLGHAEATLGWSRYQGDRATYLLTEKRDALTKWGAFVRNTLTEGDQ